MKQLKLTKVRTGETFVVNASPWIERGETPEKCFFCAAPASLSAETVSIDLLEEPLLIEPVAS